MSKKSHSLKFKLKVLVNFDNRTISAESFYRKYGITRETLKTWQRKYDKFGIQGLKESKQKKTYSRELKLAAVDDYLSGYYSLRDVADKYGLSDNSVLRRWLKDYNCHREFKADSKGRNHSMTNRKKTTWKERIEIVQDCISNGKNYEGTAKKHLVSYQQVYQWVRKYEKGGWDALKDRRGRTKSHEALTDEEKMKLEIRRIEKENERLRAENALLKKLEELERGNS